ncbi:hypothetical protein BDA96_03G216700 [Sorghum bicolor]|uniref:NADPH oxidase Respiratory burst domain-containing protein n=1 Tax=Sorghum bicolor TaxID=4558 RepID=A0A921RD64_SORBI|nr:uncharacterized protein LOC110433587 [Sorghum bicolor]KAG0538223.1 hypothetical protein BDA96_03G216700 [Sorghum bicolor]|eukprot:XP_021311695.1 uncharacterized protein LOC110433587 [Sorghum bicolor]
MDGSFTGNPEEERSYRSSCSADLCRPCTGDPIYVHPSRRAQLDSTKSGAQHAICGPLFISGSNKASNAWIEVQANFDHLACDGYLSCADFPNEVQEQRTIYIFIYASSEFKGF